MSKFSGTCQRTRPLWGFFIPGCQLWGWKTKDRTDCWIKGALKESSSVWGTVLLWSCDVCFFWSTPLSVCLDAWNDTKTLCSSCQPWSQSDHMTSHCWLMWLSNDKVTFSEILFTICWRTTFCPNKPEILGTNFIESVLAKTRLDKGKRVKKEQRGLG